MNLPPIEGLGKARWLAVENDPPLLPAGRLGPAIGTCGTTSERNRPELFLDRMPGKRYTSQFPC
jgi:hypothetical protein